MSRSTTHFAFAKKSPYFRPVHFHTSILFYFFAQRARSRYESQREQTGGTAEKNFADSTSWAEAAGSQGEGAIGRTAESAEMRRGTIKSQGVRRGREAKTRRTDAQKAQKTIRLSARWDRDVTSNRRRERTSEAARRSGALGLRKFGWSSRRLPSFSKGSTKVRVASHHQSTADLTGGTDEVTRITEIRRLHSEWNSDGSGSPRKFAAVRRAMEWENFLSWFRLKKTFVRTVILR